MFGGPFGSILGGLGASGGYMLAAAAHYVIALPAALVGAIGVIAYRPLDAFWRKRGYAPLPGVVAQFRWKDIDQSGETDHPLQFWLREL